MQESTGKQVVRAWAIFGISLAGWLLLLVLLAYVGRGDIAISIWVHAIVGFVLLLMLFTTVLTSVIWLVEQIFSSRRRP